MDLTELSTLMALTLGVWLMLNQPWTFVGLLLVFLLLLVWLLPKIWRGVKLLFAKIRSLFGGPPAQPFAAQSAEGPAAASNDGGGSSGGQS